MLPIPITQKPLKPATVNGAVKEKSPEVVVEKPPLPLISEEIIEDDLKENLKIASDSLHQPTEQTIIVSDKPTNQDYFRQKGFRVGGGQGSARIQLTEPIKIASDPPGAHIFFNGDISKKKTPDFFKLRISWSYHIEVVKEGYLPASKEIFIDSRDSIKDPIRFQLDKIPE